MRISSARDIVVVGVELGKPRSWLFTGKRSGKGRCHVKLENNCDKTTYAPPN